MDHWIIGVGCLVLMLALIFLKVPVFISMLVPAFVGYCLIGGLGFALTQFTNGPYNITSNYTFATVPMFILMGVLAAESGIAESAFRAMSMWLSWLRGGLLMATVAAAALFGACSGVSMASAAVFTKVSMPELEKLKYDKSLALGCIAASGGLSSLIPPSVPIILFCVLSQVSIGKALVGGIIPGVLMAIVLGLTIWVIGRIHPQQIPVGNVKVTWKERFLSLTLLWPILFIFVLVVGGMYLGIFPATVAGAIAAAAVLIYALIRRVNRKLILGSFWETALINVQLFPIIIGGFMFSRLVALSGLTAFLGDAISHLGIHPLAVMAIIVVIYLILGTSLELFSMLVITIPIVFPVLTGLGFDPIMLCIILVFLCDFAGLTPPVGLLLFIVAGVAKVKPSVVVRGMWPFFFVELGLMCIVIVVPSLATWLPGLLYK